MISNILKTIRKTERIVWKNNILLIFTLILIFPNIYYFLTMKILNKLPSDEESFIMTAVIAFIIIFYVITILIFPKKFINVTKKISNELDFILQISNNTNEIIIQLDSLGRIINTNQALISTLNLSKNKILGRPFREIFSFSETSADYHYKYIILDKMKEVFSGRETEIISPIAVSGSDELFSIYLKLKPRFNGNELKDIFVIGRLLQNDPIINKWLKTEKSHYIISNDFTHVHLFCHRLTRNLPDAIDRGTLIMLQIALQEVIINSIEHGNLEISYDTKTYIHQMEGSYFLNLISKADKNFIENRKIYVDYILDPKKAVYVITDEGKGFDWRAQIKKLDEKAGNLISLDYHGAGLELVRNIFDSVEFNEKGNSVTLTKNFSTAKGV